MYIVKFERGYFNSEHHIKTDCDLNVFLSQVPCLLRTAIPDKDGKELQVRIEKCAEGGNPETAHDENQE